MSGVQAVILATLFGPARRRPSSTLGAADGSAMPSLEYLIRHAHRVDFLELLREWVATRRPPNAAELLEAIDRRERELVSLN
jgi:hypothetical protein